MEPMNAGELVKVTNGSSELDGIVFDVPSRSKVVVAIVDPARGPGFRTVHPRALTERTDDGPDDRALRLLLRRTPTPPARDTSSARANAGRSDPGHTRGASHRSTGK
jgi:hypothetical protein